MCYKSGAEVLWEWTVLKKGMYRNLWNPIKCRTNRFGKDDIKRFWKSRCWVDPQNIEACHRLKSDDNGWSNKVIVKFNTCKDMVRVLNNKKIPKKF